MLKSRTGVAGKSSGSAHEVAAAETGLCEAIGEDSPLVGLLWISPWLIGFLVFFAFPMALSLYYSMSDYSMLEKPLFTGLSNYTRLFSDEIFHKVLWNTLVYAAFAIPLGTILALVIASLLNRKMRGVEVARASVFVPTVVPIVASAMIWMWLFNGEHGLINEALSLVGVDGPNWLNERGWAMPALIVMSLWNIGQPVVIYLAALQEVPESLYEAASLDGVGPVRRFLRVTLPLISPVILFNCIIQTITAWQVFAVPYIMTEGGPDRATYFYSHYLYDNAFQYQQMGYACAMAWVQFMVIMGLTAIMFLVSRRMVYYRVS